VRLTVADDAEAASEIAAERMATAISGARAARGEAHVALAGGETPRRAYELLGPLVGDWSGVHLWFGDERCVPPDDPESNYRLVRETLLAGADIPEEQVHRISGERPPAEAAAAYEDELRRLVPAGDAGLPALDLAFLGLGRDGHTASLFPDDRALGRDDALCFPVRGAKPPPNRITLSLPLLRAARSVLVLATGEGKRRAVASVRAGPSRSTPASLLPPERTEIVVDAAAAPE
jgi:6-phosphogluconolactonase